MLERLELKDVGPAPHLEIDLAPRLNLITGDNGLGKTFLLDVAWWALTRTWVSYPAAPHRGDAVKPTITYRYHDKRGELEQTSRYNFEAQHWAAMKGQRALVLYARVDGSFSVWDPERNRRAGFPRSFPATFGGSGRPQAYHFGPREIWDGLETAGRVLCNGLIRDWASWQGRGDASFQHLQEALETLSPSEDERLEPGELTRISLEDVRDMPTLKTPYGQEVPVVYASAAVKRIIALAYLLVWTWQEHVQASRLVNREVTRQIIFLIDEIEAHLHPRWQRTILRSLLRVMSALTGAEDVQVQVLAVTHSPLLLASLEPLFDADQDALWNLDLVDEKVELRREVWRRRGDANAWLISDIFDLEEPRSLEAEQAIQSAKEQMRRKDVQPDEYAAVREALCRSLPDIDPFWMRWDYWATQAGLTR